MNITSKLYLCKNVELDPNYNYTLDFETKDLQAEYFASKKVANLVPEDDYSYIRMDDTIKVYALIDDLFGVNYMYFINKGKVYYAFITSKSYVNEECTLITFKIDVLQTFMFDYEVEESFVEREHQDRISTDGNIYNLEPENINYGSEYYTERTNMIIDSVDGTEDGEVSYLYIFSKDKLAKDVSGNDDFIYIENDIPIGRYVYCLPICNKQLWYDNFTLTKGVHIENFIKDSRISQIIISKIPPCKFNFTPSNNGYKIDYVSGVRQVIIEASTGSVYKELNLLNITYRLNNKLIKFDTPLPMPDTLPIEAVDINNPKVFTLETKLYTYPYNFNKVKYGGNEIIIKNEYSYGSYLKAYQSLSNDATSFVDISNYLSYPYEDDPNIDKNTDLLLTNQTPNYIDLATDKWEQYILQNKAQRTAGFVTTGISTAIGVAGSIATGNPVLALGGVVSSVASGSSRIASTLAKEQDIKNQPNDLRQYNGDIGLSLTTTNLSAQIVNYTLPIEWQLKLFEYFYHYGYKCNNFKKPNLRSRYYFNYIKLIDANIKTNIDSEYRDEIVNAFNNGITIWHYRDANTFKGVNNYYYENAEMSIIGGN